MVLLVVDWFCIKIKGIVDINKIRYEDEIAIHDAISRTIKPETRIVVNIVISISLGWRI